MQIQGGITTAMVFAQERAQEERLSYTVYKLEDLFYIFSSLEPVADAYQPIAEVPG